MTLSRSLLEAIARAVHRAGGDLDDARDLVAVWERVDRDLGPRVDRMRRAAATVTCRCVDGGDEPTADGQCSRCWGRLEGQP